MEDGPTENEFILKAQIDKYKAENDVLRTQIKEVRQQRDRLRTELALWGKSCATCPHHTIHFDCPAIEAASALAATAEGADDAAWKDARRAAGREVSEDAGNGD